MSILFPVVRRQVLAFMLLAASLVIVNRAMALKNAENQDVRDLLSLAAQQSASLDYDADQMQSLLHSDAAWQTHAMLLESVKGHVNQLSRTDCQAPGGTKRGFYLAAKGDRPGGTFTTGARRKHNCCDQPRQQESSSPCFRVLCRLPR